MSRFVSVIEAVDDRLNPIVVRDLRRAVRNKLIIGLLWVFLAISFLVVCWMSWILPLADDYLVNGRDVFIALNSVMLAACMVGLPTYCGIMIALERTQQAIDTLAMTTLSPGNIVRGKFLSGLVLVGLIFSACAPFLTFTCLLRGIDIPSVFVALVFGLLLSATALAVSLLVGSLRMPLIAVAVAGLFLLGALVWGMVLASIGCAEMVSQGIGSELLSWDQDTWLAALIVVVMLLFLGGLCVQTTVAITAPPTANRALPVRLFLAAGWLISGLAWLAGSYALDGDTALELAIVWGLLANAVLTVALLAAVGERESWGGRVRKMIPRPRLLRWLAFPFYSGLANGVVFSVGLLLVTNLAVVLASVYRFATTSADIAIALIGPCLALYAFCYVFTGRFLQRHLFSHWIAKAYTWVISVGLAIAAVILGALFYALDNFVVSVVLCPFILFDYDTHWYLRYSSCIISGLIWALIVGLLSARSLWRQFRDFQPLVGNKE